MGFTLKSKLASVVIPVHGDGDYFQECLDSVVGQTLQQNISLEILIVADRIKFNILDFTKAYNDKRIKIIYSPAPGIVEALNLGLKHALGEYIVRIDSDDYMHRDRVRSQIDYLELHPEIDVIGTQIQIINEQGDKLFVSRYPESPRDVSSALKSSCVIAHPSVTYRKSAAIGVGGYSKFYEHAEDYDLWLRILKNENIANLHENLTYYRVHDRQISKLKNEHQQWATLAARLSFSLREKKKDPLEKNYVNLQEWMTGKKYSLFALKIYISSKYTQSRRSGKLINSIAYFLPYTILHPGYVSSIYNKFRGGAYR